MSVCASATPTWLSAATPGTGSPSDVDDFDDDDNEEDTPEVARDAESDDGFGNILNRKVDVFCYRKWTSPQDRRSDEDDDSDSSLEPGMQRAKIICLPLIKVSLSPFPRAYKKKFQNY